MFLFSLFFSIFFFDFVCLQLFWLFSWSFFFFFKQKTAYEMRISDWSSDVCSSDLRCATTPIEEPIHGSSRHHHAPRAAHPHDHGDRDRRLGAHHLDADQERLSARRRLGPGGVSQDERREIGRASCRERVCQYV